MKFLKVFIITLLFNVSPAMADQPIQVLFQGLEANKEFYMVACPDSKRSSITVIYDHPELFTQDLTNEVFVPQPQVEQICIYPHTGTEKCQPQWNIDEAAKASCP